MWRVSTRGPICTAQNIGTSPPRARSTGKSRARSCSRPSRIRSGPNRSRNGSRPRRRGMRGWRRRRNEPGWLKSRLTRRRSTRHGKPRNEPRNRPHNRRHNRLPVRPHSRPRTRLHKKLHNRPHNGPPMRQPNKLRRNRLHSRRSKLQRRGRRSWIGRQASRLPNWPPGKPRRNRPQNGRRRRWPGSGQSTLPSKLARSRLKPRKKLRPPGLLTRRLNWLRSKRHGSNRFQGE